MSHCCIAGDIGLSFSLKRPRGKEMAPVPTEVASLVEKYINENALMIFSKSYCPFCKEVCTFLWSYIFCSSDQLTCDERFSFESQARCSIIRYRVQYIPKHCSFFNAGILSVLLERCLPVICSCFL